MITKVKKIKNLGIFHDYTSKPTTPELKRYSLIYGWNGSGKTTLSRLFCALETGESIKFPNLEYKLESDTGTVLKQKVPYSESKVMVFNQDYIHENAPSLDDPYTQTKHIYLLGKEDKELAKQIDAGKKELAKLKEDSDPKKKGSQLYRKKELDDARITLFKNTADTVAAIKGGTRSRTYNRNNAIAVYDKLKEKQELSAKELADTRKIVDQQMLDDITDIAPAPISIQREGKTETLSCEDFLKRVKDSTVLTLNETVQQVIIERLKDNEDVADWVAQGMVIHESYKSKKCEYCGQNIPKKRLDELAKHFNEAYSKLITKIEVQTKSLETVKARLAQLRLHDKANFYSQFQDDYEKEKDLLEIEKEKVVKTIDSAITLLEGKKMKTHEKVALTEEIDTKNLMSHMAEVNKVIGKHNAHTKSFKSTVDDAREKLEKHYVSQIFNQVKKIDDEVAELSADIAKTTGRIEDLKTKIETDEATIRNSGEACEDINKCLVGILGRDELVFEDQEEGYSIKRNGVIAENLSEGEKTAIAFAYFVIHLKNKDFDFKQGIVLIDDPISSLDVEGIFRVCTLMDTKLKQAKQLIILTHNFDFFNQIKKWFMNDPAINNKEKDEDKQGALLMIKTRYNDKAKRRVALIDNLDPLLRDYESEYHYLFKKLADFKKDTVVSAQGTIEAVYHYPNVARKVLECFLSFRVPARGTMYTRMLKMKDFNKDISTTDIKEVYNFINSNSHLDTKTGLIQFDPSLGMNGERYIDKTLELIKKCDQEHYDSMVKLL